MTLVSFLISRACQLSSGQWREERREHLGSVMSYDCRTKQYEVKSHTDGARYVVGEDQVVPILPL